MNDEMIRKLIMRAIAYNGHSYAPYSRFNVSAAVLMSTGEIFEGANIENASYPCGICAERTAIAHAIAERKAEIVAVAIVGGKDHVFSDYCTPCGMCRQVMREFGNPKKLQVIVAKSVDDYRIFTLDQLLPESFGPASLTM